MWVISAVSDIIVHHHDHILIGHSVSVENLGSGLSLMVQMSGCLVLLTHLVGMTDISLVSVVVPAPGPRHQDCPHLPPRTALHHGSLHTDPDQ